MVYCIISPARRRFPAPAFPPARADLFRKKQRLRGMREESADTKSWCSKDRGSIGTHGSSNLMVHFPMIYHDVHWFCPIQWPFGGYIQIYFSETSILYNLEEVSRESLEMGQAWMGYHWITVQLFECGTWKCLVYSACDDYIKTTSNGFSIVMQIQKRMECCTNIQTNLLLNLVFHHHFPSKNSNFWGMYPRLRHGQGHGPGWTTTDHSGL